MPARIRCTWTDAELVNAVAESKSFTGTLRLIGLVPAGGNFDTVRKHIQRLSLSTDHFLPHGGSGLFLKLHHRRKLTEDEVFCENSHVSAQVARYARRYSIMPYICGICGNTGEHNGKSLQLQLDHKNGNRRDNRKENLWWLCPNCHSQTSTFAGRNQNKRRAHVLKPRQNRMKVPYSVLAKRYAELHNFVAVAHEFHVSDTTVRKAVLHSRIV